MLGGFILRRMGLMIPTVILTSMIAFAVIQLPPGDFLTSYVAQLSASGEQIDDAVVEVLRARYGLEQPIHVRYWLWVSGMVRGDFGQSLEWNRPVRDILWERIPLTALLSFLTLIFMWLVALPIGLYSAVRQYSLTDYVVTFIGFIGLATPNFMLALIFMWLAYVHFGTSIGGLFSDAYLGAPWTWHKFVDLLRHVWIPVVVVGTAGTAALIRIFRANLLDELQKPYVETARSKGLSEMRLLMKYPVRVALNPFISTIGWSLPQLISGFAIVSVVLSLPTTGPVLLRALQSQDMYLAGSFILMLSILTVVGTLISDILLALVDPRIRSG